jgi:hypothetical protein
LPVPFETHFHVLITISGLELKYFLLKLETSDEWISEHADDVRYVVHLINSTLKEPVL